MKLLVFIPVVAILLMAFSKEKLNMPIENNVLEKVIEPQPVIPAQNEQTSLVINIKNDGYYIDNKLCTLDEVVNKAKTWQKGNNKEILLSPDAQVPQTRSNEVRKALEAERVFFINQLVPETGEIIYPHGDVTSLAKFKNGKWDVWFQNQLKSILKEELKNSECPIEFGFIIDKNGRVRDGLIIKPCDVPEINAAYEKILTQIPDWEPAKKGGKEVSVFYRGIQKIVTVTKVVEKK